MSEPALREKPPVPYGHLSRRSVRLAVARCLSEPTHRAKERALVQLVGVLMDRIEENEAIIEAGSQPCCEGPRRLEP